MMSRNASNAAGLRLTGLWELAALHARTATTHIHWGIVAINMKPPRTLGTDMHPGRLYAVGNKVFGVCAWCEKLVRADKPIVGGLHICLTEEEAAIKLRILGRRGP